MPARSSGLLGGDFAPNEGVEIVKALRPAVGRWHRAQDSSRKAAVLNVCSSRKIHTLRSKNPRRGHLVQPMRELGIGWIRPHQTAQLAVRNETAAWPSTQQDYFCPATHGATLADDVELCHLVHLTRR